MTHYLYHVYIKTNTKDEGFEISLFIFSCPTCVIPARPRGGLHLLTIREKSMLHEWSRLRGHQVTISKSQMRVETSLM